MKNSIRMMILIVLVCATSACSEKKLTFEDMKKAEATLFKQDGTLDSANFPKVADKYIKFVEQNPDDTTASLWLYHAMELNVMMKNSEKAVALCDNLMNNYPDSKWTPRGMYILGSMVYEDQYKDLDKAREILEKILSDYPGSEIEESVKASIKYLGWTPEQIMNDISLSQFEKGQEFN